MFLETVPDTLNYMIAGYIFSFVVMGFYVFSIYLRSANLKRDAEMLESLDKENTKKK
ncbi:MAG TPA: hypothetical protein PKV19_00345 [Anaerolineales bacterium]|nr:hypothetical protein [Anaerolineales bacterium]